ncbi:metal-dependent hydrolase, partial [Brevibacterium paucivorans]
MTAADVERMLRSGEMTVVRSARRKKTYSLQPTADGWKLAVP